MVTVLCAGSVARARSPAAGRVAAIRRKLACQCGCRTPEEVSDRLDALAASLAQLELFAGRQLRVLSGYRCPAHNAREGGAPRSRHLVGDAADVLENGLLDGPRRGYPVWTGEELRGRVLAAIAAGVLPEGGVGTYTAPRKRWTVHYDQRGEPARWVD